MQSWKMLWECGLRKAKKRMDVEFKVSRHALCPRGVSAKISTCCYKCRASCSTSSFQTAGIQQRFKLYSERHHWGLQGARRWRFLGYSLKVAQIQHKCPDLFTRGRKSHQNHFLQSQNSPGFRHLAYLTWDDFEVDILGRGSYVCILIRCLCAIPQSLDLFVCGSLMLESSFLQISHWLPQLILMGLNVHFPLEL